MEKQTQNTLTARLPIWSPGTFRSMSGHEFEFSDQMLGQIARSYSPDTFAAPWVKGHPAADDPAQGWIDSLEWDGKFLWAQSSKISPQFAQQVRDGRYAKLSPRFFLPDEPSNPSPGSYYLRHLGWLGAAAPANKALPMAGFSEQPGTATFIGVDVGEPVFADATTTQGFAVIKEWLTSLREAWIDKFGRDEADKTIPAYLIDQLAPAAEPEPNPKPEPDMPESQPDNQAAFTELQTQNTQLRGQLDQLQADSKAAAQTQRQLASAAFTETLVQAGQLLPAEQPFITALLARFDDQAQATFAEGDKEVTVAVTPRLESFLKALPKRVDYSESAAGAADPSIPAFAAPHGYSVDPTRDELHGKALAWQKTHSGCSYEDAIAAVSQ